MNLSGFFQRFTFSIFIVFVITAAFLLWDFSPKTESATRAATDETLPNYDIRLDKSETAKRAIEKFSAQSGQAGSTIESGRSQAARGAAKLRSEIPDLKIEYNEDLRIPEVISPDFMRSSNFLTAPADEKRADILQNFIRQNVELFGLTQAQILQLEKTADYTNPDGNLSYVLFEQKINSIPVFRGEIKAGFTRKNEIVRIINNLAPKLDYQKISNDFGKAEEALERAARHLHLQTNEADTRRIEAASNDLKITFESGQFDDKTTAEKIYFPIDYGVARPAWRVLIWTRIAAFYVIVDAETGTLLWRKNIAESQTQTSTFNVYGNTNSLMKTADSAAPVLTLLCQSPQNCPQPNLRTRQSFTLIGNEPPYTFNNTGWIPDGENRTIGNNAEAGIDRISPTGIDDNGWAFGNPTRNFVYAYNPAPGNPAPGEEPLPTPQTYPPSAFQQGSITNAFYTVNRWHDEMYLLGFTEQARNFQTDNFGNGGLGNDSISVEVQDGSGTNGANFFTPADGNRPRLQLFVWTTPTPDRDGALDNQVIVHEITHGLSSRLHGNGSGLGGQGGMMGEGWSDFYALALLSKSVDEQLGTYSVGCYSLAGIINCYHGLRRFPVARKAAVGANGLPHNPLTFGYLNAGCDTLIGTTTTNPNSAFPRNPALATSGNCAQIHNGGEIWASALWEMRGQLIDIHDQAAGNRRALQYTTDGMKLAPLNPNMLQERDAIFAAVMVANPADFCAVSRGFAIRGMGFSASVQTVTIVTEAFNLPLQCRRTTRADFDGDGKSDISVFRPNEGNWYLNRSTAGFNATNWGLSTDQLVPGDYDGDQKTDLAVFRPSADANLPDFYILNSSNFTVSGYSWGNPNDVPVVEDYDGDGKDDVAVVRPTPFNFLWYVLKSTGGAQVYNNLSSLQSPAQPVAGDFDGDGKGDLATPITFNGEYFWYVVGSIHGTRVTQFKWGLAGDKIVTGDYDGDGIDDAAVYRPSNSTWYIRKSSGGTTTVNFGSATDIPAPADYDGDGRTDIAVYRGGTWYVNASTAGLQISQFGLGGDMPIANRYLP